MAQPQGGQVQDQRPAAPQAQAAPEVVPQFGVAAAPPPRLRNRNPRNILRRYRYTEAQKQRAIHLLDQGLSCRRTARLVSPHCSPGTVCRWRKIRNIRLEIQRQMDMFRQGQRF